MGVRRADAVIPTSVTTWQTTPRLERGIANRYIADLAGVIQLVECQLPKLDVAGSSPVARSLRINELQRRRNR